MREILFRGKQHYSGEWLYGQLIHNIVDGGENDSDTSHYIDAWDIADTKGNNNMVDERTIGQYIGRCDNNGTKIFEGDIVELTFNKKRVCRKVSCHDTYQGFDITPSMSDFGFGVDAKYRNVIVVGNVYDNAELLTERT